MTTLVQKCTTVTPLLKKSQALAGKAVKGLPENSTKVRDTHGHYLTCYLAFIAFQKIWLKIWNKISQILKYLILQFHGMHKIFFSIIENVLCVCNTWDKISLWHFLDLYRAHKCVNNLQLKVSILSFYLV